MRVEYKNIFNKVNEFKKHKTNKYKLDFVYCLCAHSIAFFTGTVIVK